MLQRIFIIVLFIGFIILLLVIGLRNRINDEDSKGKSPINKFLFVLAKLAFFVPWFMSFLGAIRPELLPVYYHVKLAWLGILLIMIGFAIVITGYISLGKYTKFGLPTNESRLITTGIYKYCRNPMYLGLFLMITGATLCFPHWILFACCIMAIALHHYIVLAEEEYMKYTFGKAWEDYKITSKRYLLW